MTFYEEMSRNKRTTFLLFLAFFVLFFALGYFFSFFLGDYIFLPIFGIFSIIYILITYYASDRIVTAISGAKPAPPEEYKVLNDVVDEMAIASGLPKPKVYVIEDTAINAFATGRDPKHSVICVTTGAIDRLKREELKGVVAHEMSHIKNYDIRVMTIAAVLVGLTVLLSDFFLRVVFSGGMRKSEGRGGAALFVIMLVAGVLLALLTPLVAQLINFSISRRREYLADASAAEITRYPDGLADALESIKNDKEVLEAANKATAHLYIANPLKGQKLWLKSLFSTHPPIEERIAKLRAM